MNIVQSKTQLVIVGAGLAALALAILFAISGSNSRAAADAGTAPEPKLWVVFDEGDRSGRLQRPATTWPARASSPQTTPAAT
jgi:hypothetical protein